jgi:glycosyltransferase involved in cell wall biosynthesis
MLSIAASGRRILVVSGDMLPLPGLPTTGAGLRAWGLIKGLEARGHDVVYLMPETSLKSAALGVDRSAYRSRTYNNLSSDDLYRHIKDLSPDVLVFQHWSTAASFAGSSIPMAIDFHGPLLLETLYQDLPHYEGLRQVKIQTLAKADFFTCAGQRQRHYFYPWLMQAGFDLRHDLIQVIPVSLSPDMPARSPAVGEVTFVYGGVFLPWQDPSLALETLVTTLEERQTGRLKLFGGKHPSIQIPPGKYHDLLPRLDRSPRVELMGMIPRDALVDTYLRSHVAIDVMVRNPERELAFTTRTVEYLWCGLPVIYNNYAELADYIRDYDAGWTVDPLDANAIRSVIEAILDDPACVARKSINAQRLVRERLTWERTIEPLDAFCREPRKHSGHRYLTPTQSVRRTVALEQFAARALPDIRRARRTLPARILAIVKETAKRIVRQQYIAEAAGRQVTAGRPLLGRHPHSQTFQAQAPGLSGIEVLIGTYGRLNSCDLVLHLSDTQGAAIERATATLNASALQDGTFCRFEFAPLADSEDREFTFWLESPDAVLGDCITVFTAVNRRDIVFSPVYAQVDTTVKVEIDEELFDGLGSAIDVTGLDADVVRSLHEDSTQT